MGSDRNKVLLPVAGQPIIAWSLRAFTKHPAIDRVVLVCSSADRRELAEIISTTELRATELIVGGQERADSERAALHYLRDQIDTGSVGVIAIHDGARPFISADLISRSLGALAQHSVVGAVPALSAPALLVGRRESLGPLPPGEVVRVQTPQVFRARPLLRAYDTAATTGFVGTDTSSYIEQCESGSVQVVDGEEQNFKVTFMPDLARAQRLAIDLR